jgi:hypothetical protein
MIAIVFFLNFFLLHLSPAEASWSQLRVFDQNTVFSLAVYKGKLYVGVGEDGRVYSYDGEKWEEVFDPPETYVTDMIVYGENLYVATGRDGRIYTTSDGLNWELSLDTGKLYVYSLEVYDGKLWAGSGYYLQVWVFDGYSWQSSYQTSYDYYANSMRVYENVLYVGTTPYGKIYRYDGTWSLAQDLPEYGVYSLFVFENTLYIGTGGNGRIYTFDGENWILEFDSPDTEIRTFEEYGGLLYAGSTYSGRIYRRENDGWKEIYDTLQDEVDALRTYGVKLYAGTSYRGMVLSFTEFDFSLDASTTQVSIGRNESVDVEITVNLTSGVPDNVTLSGEWVLETPEEMTASLSRTRGEPPFSSVLTITTSPSITSQTRVFRVTASWENVLKSIDITVKVTAPPAAPALFAPADGIVLDDLTPVLEWEPAPDAESYTVHVATDNQFTFIVYDTTTTDTQVEVAQLQYGTRYYWRVRATNQYGTGEWSDVWSFRLSATPPKVLSLVVENGAKFVSSRGISVLVRAQNAAEISFSTDGIIWSDWEPYENVKEYTLPEGDGEKTIYVRVRDNEGNLSLPVSVSVMLDQTPPTTTHSIQGTQGEHGYLSSALVQFKAVDATSGVASTYYRVDGGEWKSGDSVLISEPGTHTVEYYSVDLAGNAEEITQLRVRIYVPGAGLPASAWGALAAIAGAALGVAYWWYRGKPVRRLREIELERRELERMKRKADRDYFDLGKISRETYDSIILRYKERMSELEREARVLKQKLKRK